MPLWTLLERTGGTARAPWDASLEPLREDRLDPMRALGCLSEPLRERAGGTAARLGMPFWSLLQKPAALHARLGMPLWSLLERTGGTPRAPWDASLEPFREDRRDPMGCLSGPSQRGPAGPHARLGMPLWSLSEGTHARLGMPL